MEGLTDADETTASDAAVEIGSEKSIILYIYKLAA